MTNRKTEQVLEEEERKCGGREKDLDQQIVIPGKENVKAVA